MPGVISRNAKDAKSEEDCWKLFFDNNILSIIVERTNDYIESIRNKFVRDRNCKPTDIVELQAFFGLLYLAGVFRGGHQNISDFWATDGLGIDIFRMTMSEKRFRFIIRCLRFDDRSTRRQRCETDKLAAVREIFSLFIENCKLHYHLGENVTIDEMLPAFRGRCGFRQYIPSKPTKYGIKIFCLADAKLFYTTNMEIYCGQQPEGPYRKSNSAEDIVMRLAEPIYGSGRNITADNWFTSLKLVKALEKKKISYVGTVRKNRRELPPSFTTPKNRIQYDSIFGFTKNETLVSYVPKKGRTVVLLSSKHTSTSTLIDDRDKKPEIIEFYNQTKSGVDVVDKLCATYNVARSTRRWPMVIFYHLLNVAAINARIIFLGNKNEYISRREYLKKLSLSLVSEQLKRRSLIESLPTELKNMLAKYKPTTLPANIDQPGTSENGGVRNQPETVRRGLKRKRCESCYKESKQDARTTYVCEKCGTYICLKKHVRAVCKNCLDDGIVESQTIECESE